MAVLAATRSLIPRSKAAEEDIDARRIPRWRGFNLQGRFAMLDRPHDGRAYDEFDFATLAEWEFDFARLPLSYWAARMAGRLSEKSR
jgi:aryl-phospho-beta-D-glucosidase BglC (GH1 family)